MTQSIESPLLRFAAVVAIAVAAHLTTLLVQSLSRSLLRSRMRSEAKALTITGFVTSMTIFGIYFAAFGFALSELGISLTTYLASASVIGLAVSFGSQGVVQDVINGLTVVFSDLLDVGDMVDIGGQTGIVEHVGMRFTALVNFSGARVFVPNRSISNVINYPNGYIRAYLDVRLPSDTGAHDGCELRLQELAESVYAQYPGIFLRPPTMLGRFSTHSESSYLRIKFRIWPGQGLLLETAIKSTAAQIMKDIDPKYADWMVTVHYRAEPASQDPAKRLPRPAVLGTRD